MKNMTEANMRDEKGRFVAAKSEASLKGWTKRLNKKELKHLRENGVRDTYTLKKQMEYTVSESQKEGGVYCHECLAIARKLGVL
ncbi:MAG: hypothetical protein J7L32_05360 [Thermoplasmata archaeon]|nr:hypothetical protein [Thermoplasmata archaeon]